MCRRFFFDGLDFDRSFTAEKTRYEKAKKDYVSSYLAKLSTAQLDEVQVDHLIKTLCTLVLADDKIEKSELFFLAKVKSTLKITDSEVYANFLEYTTLLISLPGKEIVEQEPNVISPTLFDSIFTKDPEA